MGIKKNNQGLVRFIILVIIAIFLVSYFQIDIRGIVNSDIVQTVWSFIQNIWYSYIKTPLIFILSYALSLLQ